MLSSFMNKKVLISTIFFIIVFVFSSAVLLGNRKKAEETQSPKGKEGEMVFFYGDGCPHCAAVEEYFKNKGVREKISFLEKEVYYNEENAKDLEEKAKICGIPSNTLGVPFLWDGGRCFIGDREIIDFFDQKLNSKE